MPTTDPQTSEGLFVAAPGSADVASGDVVRVQGTVGESFARTQLASLTNLAVCPGEGSVTATAVSLPVASLTEWEPHEGMLVSFDQPLTIARVLQLRPFNEIVLTDGRQSQPTSVYEPGSAEAAALAGGQPARPDHAGRRPQLPEPGSARSIRTANRSPRQPVPRRRHARERHRRARLRLRPLPRPADAGCGLHGEQNPRPAEPDPVGGNVPGRLIQRAELLHDARG